ncbi:MAG TPA: citrate lyase acyl carrier protein, partial [Candidatus Pelethocola excrementipullorum]|nr:citrate lyase acyl carrier protein [Candidatus Pelethocola excrementipullorum]
HAVAGTLESSDILVSIEPQEKGRTIEIHSVVENQFFEVILAAVEDVLDELQIESGKLMIQDRGALDCVIRARVETAAKRGGVLS